VNWTPVALHVTYGKQKASAEYDRMFGTRILFHQAINRMILPRYLMEIRHPFADQELCELLENHARQKIKDPTFGKDSLAKIHHALANSLEAGNVTLASLSRQLTQATVN
jgi:hypothetical protein